MIRMEYAKMHEKAQKLREILPLLISQKRWQDLAEAVKISSDVWCGKAASAYYEVSQTAVYNRSEELILNLPDLIDKAADDMLKDEKNLLVEVDEYLASQVSVYS